VGITISLIGATGRMGQLAKKLIEESKELSIHSELGSGNSLNEALGADLLMDFTNPDVSPRIVDFAIENNLRLLVGTSGWNKEKLERVAKKIEGSTSTVVIIPNFSVGSVLATKFAAEAAKYFDRIEIIETHHPKKLDAPSGTALYTSQAIHQSRAGKPVVSDSSAPRFNDVPITSLRIEGKHAEQEVLISQPNESLYMRHVVDSHEVYGKGILLAISKTMQRSGLTVGLLPLLEDN
jgi:4-hydroxy-tetrahydrodipicolinate reductase